MGFTGVKLLTSENLNNILNDSYNGMIDQKFIRRKYNFSQKTAERAMKKLNLYHTEQHIIDMLKDIENGMSSTQAAIKYNMTRENVNARLRIRNIERRGTTYIANFHYFDNIDTEDKAYFLGFIYADGCVYRNTLRISINKRDENLLLKFKNYIKSNHPIHYIKTYSKLTNIYSDMVNLEITNKVLKPALQNYGVISNKTFIIKFPENLDKSLYKDFIRGYLDGDGCICFYINKRKFYRKRTNDYGISNNKKYSIQFVGTIDFLESLRKIFQKELNLSVSSKLQNRWPERNTNIRSFNITGRFQVLTILDWLYKDSKVYLDRKYEKYLNLPR